MMDISDTELGPRGGIRTRLYQFVWGVTLYHNGSEIVMSPLVVATTTRDDMAILNATIKEARQYAMDILLTHSYCCTYTFTVLSDREFMMVESMVNDEAVYLYKLMGEMDLRPEVVR